MKLKVFTFMIAIVLSAFCVGCVPNIELGNIGENTKPTIMPTETPAVNTTDMPTEEPDKEPTATPETESVLQVRGTWNNGVYTNAFLGLAYTLPQGWQAANDEEILTMMGLGAELLGKEDQLEQSLESQQSIYDFYVANLTTGSNISISFENLSKVVGGFLYSEEMYADIVVNQLQALDGMTYTIGEYEEYTLGGKTFLKIPAIAEYSGVSMEQCYYIRKEGKYMCNIIVTCIPNGDHTLEQIIEAFTNA